MARGYGPSFFTEAKSALWALRHYANRHDIIATKLQVLHRRKDMFRNTLRLPSDDCRVRGILHDALVCGHYRAMHPDVLLLRHP